MAKASGILVGRNVEYAVEGNILTVKIDLSKDFGMAKGKPAVVKDGKEISPAVPGKNVIVASSGGNIVVQGFGEEIHLGVNCYKPPSKVG